MNHDLPVRFPQCGAIFVALFAGLSVAAVGEAEVDDVIKEVEQPLIRRVERRGGVRLIPVPLVDEEFQPFQRDPIETAIRIRIDEFRSKYGLSEAQQRKLRFAAHNDLIRLERECNELYQAVRTAKKADERKRLEEELERLNQTHLRLHEYESFFSKSLANVLTADQMKQYRADIEARLKLCHRSNIETALRVIERKVVLSIPQFESLVALLLKEIPSPHSASTFDEAIVQVLFARIPEFKLKPIFNDVQWPAVREILDGFRNIEPELIEQGLVAAEPADALQVENRIDRSNLGRPLIKKEG